MDARKETILKLIVDEYIRTAEPLGSKYLCEVSGLDCSPATVRNDMAVLEKEGYIKQPHTSAGRVPTEKAYVYYLQHFVGDGPLKSGQARIRKAFESAKNQEHAVKELAKTLVELSGETAIVAFGPRFSYYTGVSNLFAKPDFADLQLMQNLSEIVDRFDVVMESMFGKVGDDKLILLGSKNPFGETMSTILIKYRLPDGQPGLLGLIGPMRMNYGRNIRLIEEAKMILDEIRG